MIDPRSKSERSEDALRRAAEDAPLSDDTVKRIHDRVVNRFVDWYLTKARAEGANLAISSDALRSPILGTLKSRFRVLRRLGVPVVAASIVGISIGIWYHDRLASARAETDVERSINESARSRVSELEQKIATLETARAEDANMYSQLNRKYEFTERELHTAKEEIVAKDKQVQEFSEVMAGLLTKLKAPPQLAPANANAMNSAHSHGQLSAPAVAPNTAKSASGRTIRAAAAMSDKK